MPVPMRNPLYFSLFVPSEPHNLLPGVFSVFLLVLYGILVTKSRCIRCHKKRKPGCIFLEGDTAPGHQLYAVIVDTGFRSPAQFTSKVPWTPNGLLVRSRREDEPEGQRKDNEMIWLPCQSPVTTVPLKCQGDAYLQFPLSPCVFVKTGPTPSAPGFPAPFLPPR